jgi:hypothetical protein
VAREAVVTVAAGGVGGGVEDIPAFAARSAARAGDESRPGLDHEAGVVARRCRVLRSLAWARGSVEVFAIGAVPTDCRAAAGVAHEGVVGGEDGAEGEGVVIWVLGSAMGGRPGVAHVSAGSCA